jgi:hypothetical protein
MSARPDPDLQTPLASARPAGRPPRQIRVVFREAWAGPEQGFLARDDRVRTLRRVLISYPDVRHIRPDVISLAATPDLRNVESLTRFLQRQQWLVRSVVVE